MPVSTQPRMIETLQGMLEELCSPDLTLGRAKALRHRLTRLLETMNSSEAGASDRSGTEAEPRN